MHWRKSAKSIEQKVPIITLIGYFSAGILPFLMWHIMLMDTIPSMIQEWYSKAIHFQTQWEWAKEISKKNQHPIQYSYQSFNSSTSKAKDPNAMDVDVVYVGKLTSDERKCCIKKGLCFHCQKQATSVENAPPFQTRNTIDKSNR